MKKIYMKPVVESTATCFEDYLMAGTKADINGQEGPGIGDVSNEHAKRNGLWDNWEDDDENSSSWE